MKKSINIFLLFTLLSSAFFSTAANSTFIKEFTNAEVENKLASRSTYVFENSPSYLYNAALGDERNDGLFDGANYFKSELLKRRPESFPEWAWVPISGDITFFIEVPINVLAKFAASPYVERGLVQDQIQKSIGKRWISGFSSMEEQTRRLYANGLDLAIQEELVYGQNLSASFLDNIPYDVIWPEKRKISGHDVIVPIVYLKNSTIEKEKASANTLAFGSADLTYSSFELEGADIIGQRNAIITVSNSFKNTDGSVEVGGDLSITAGQSIENYSGIMSADNLTLNAEKIKNGTLVTRYDFGYGYSVTAGQIAVITALGDLTLDTAGDLVVEGAQLSSNGTLSITSGNNVHIITQIEEYNSSQSGSFWSDTQQATTNIQSTLTGAEISILANNQIVLQGAVIESAGNLKLLADMGIYISNVNDETSFNKTFEVSSSGLFGNEITEKEQRYKSEIVNTLLTAGKNIQISTAMGNITFKGVDLNSEDLIQIEAEDGKIEFLLATESSSYNYEYREEDMFYFSSKNKGHNIERGIYNSIIAQGGFIANASQGFTIEYATEHASCEMAGYGDQCLADIVNNLGESPEYAWLKQIHDDPNSEVDWHSVATTMESWDYKQQGLTEAGALIVSIAVTMAAGPGAGNLAAGIAGKGTLIAASLSAGMTSLATTASIAMFSNGFDIGATVHQMGSSENVKSLANTMVTAGVMAGVNNYLMNPQGELVQVDGLTEGTKGGWNLPDISEQALQSLASATVSSGVSALVYGQNFDEFKDSFYTALVIDAVNEIGKSIANDIGEAANDKNAPLELGPQLIAHAALGCGLGVVKDNINGSNSDSACVSGAGGGVIGELIAQRIRNDFFDEQGQLAENSELTLEEKKAKITKIYDEYKEQGVNFAKLGAALAVYSAGGDGRIASDTAENAARHNAFWFLAIPIIIAFDKAYTVYEEVVWATDLAEALSSNDDAEAKRLLKEKAEFFGIAAATKTLPLGGILSKIIQKVQEKVKDYPGMEAVVDDLSYYLENIQNGTTHAMVAGPNTRQIGKPIIETSSGYPRVKSKSARILENKQISDALYNKLRSKTPPPELTAEVNLSFVPPYPDPALINQTVTGRVQLDHIVPMLTISKMDGFGSLSEADQLLILNNLENLTPMSEAANKSRGSRTFKEWLGHKSKNANVRPEFKEKMMKLESILQVKIQKQIDDLNNKR